MKYLSFVAALSALCVPKLASACGGFFCSTTPIDQKGERILFVHDPALGQMETHVQINYQGAAEDFAWVVPVPTVPDLKLSSDAIFSQLDQQTRPRFFLDYEYDDNCDWGQGCGGGWCEFADDRDPAASPTAGNPQESVTVVAQSQVGPYDSVVLQADDAEALLTWLQDNQYLLPDSLMPVLNPYVQADSYFVALRLSNDSSTGDLAPIAMTYQGNKPVIPLKLTSIAAQPDMRLEVYVLGAERAVPSNYLHVTINEAAIDWLGGGSNYEDVITQAANEAGGHAFATDMAQKTTAANNPFQNFDSFAENDLLDTLRAIADTNPANYIDALRSSAFPRGASTLELFREFMPMPQAMVDEGFLDTTFYNCISCYSEYTAGYTFDVSAMTDALDERILRPGVKMSEAWLKAGYFSRLTSSVSPEEMTLDPVFVFNRNMGPVDNLHRATLVYTCGPNQAPWEANRHLRLGSNRVIQVPPESTFNDSFASTADFASGLAEPAALSIEQTSEGEARAFTLLDNRAVIDRVIVDHNAKIETKASGGCDQSNGTGALLLMLLPIGMCRRSRRSRRT